MSTRGCIARTTGSEGEFPGVYHHSDSYPTWLGARLWRLVHKKFSSDLRKMLLYVIDKHPAGWSQLGDESECYCNPKWKRAAESGFAFTHENIAGSDCEWLYVFDEEHNKLFVRDLSHKEDVGVIDLARPEPDWSKIECGENFERCQHYAWYHNLAPKTSNLSTQTFLGKRPLEFRDAVAFVIDGKRHKATGCGGNSNYFNRNGKSFPRNTWIAIVQAGNGKRIELPVAKITSKGYEPLPGVILIYPPTKNNPNETEVTA